MAHYLIYLPGKSGASPDLLAEAGLADLLPAVRGDMGPDFTPVLQHGPDGAAGVLVSWNDPHHPERQALRTIDPSRQQWTNAGRFWLGLEPARPPGPDDLMRRTLRDGTWVKLRDGNPWLVPAAAQLPHIVRSDDSRTIAPEFADFYEQAAAFMDLYAEHTETADTWAGLTLPGAARFAARALGMNYRINPAIADWLGLFDDEALFWTVGATFELQLRVAVEDQKKNSAVAG